MAGAGWPLIPVCNDAVFPTLLCRAEGLHDLHRTCATILLMAGKHSEHVQGLQGHPSISLTLDVYSYTMEGMAGGLPDVIDETL